MTDVSIRTMLLEFVDSNGASHIREMHIEILRHKPDTPEHAKRARLAEAVADGVFDRLCWLTWGDSLTHSRHVDARDHGPRRTEILTSASSRLIIGVIAA